MAALVQAFPTQQSSNSLPLLQPRPQSASGALQPSTQNQSHSHIMQHRSMGSYGPSSTTTNNNNASGNGYRGYSSTAPVAPYAFTSTPSLSNNKPTQQAWSDSKNALGRPDESRPRYTVSDSVSTSSSSSMSSEPSNRYHTGQGRPRFDLATGRPLSVNVRSVSSPVLPTPPIMPAAASTTSRPSPDRYRRGNKKVDGGAPSPVLPSPVGSAMPSGSGMAAVGALYSQPQMSSSSQSVSGRGKKVGSTTLQAGGLVKPGFIENYPGQLRSHSVDDIHTHRLPHDNMSQQQAHNRRRSVGAFTAESLSFLSNSVDNADLRDVRLATLSPHLVSSSLHQAKLEANGANHKGPVPTSSAALPMPAFSRRGSADSSNSGQSSASQSRRPNSRPSSATHNSSPMVPSSHEINLAHVPARDSSNVNKRTTAPSPLSRPVTMGADSSPMSPPVRSNTEGPNSAAERLAALSADPKRGLKNRLRRAFSFGSAAELRKAAAGNSTDVAERTRLRQERYREEQEAEQRRVAEQQEASGLGEGIYNGQGHFFTGSTDNISVSSTASSASIMIRKMGKGMKKSTRSLVGLFRPKSITGVEAASGPVATGPSAAQVTMLTVEAEREKVNVNLDPHDHVGGGTGFPKLARNSIDAASVNAVSPAPANESSGSGGRLDDAGPRKSTIGGEKERAEILAVVKKGILKRSGSSSPIIKPADAQADNKLPQISAANENIRPGSGKQHQKNGSLSIDGEDYFMSSPKFRGSKATSSSAPSSPNGTKYNVSFSPRITFHDTWPSGEYDRRGDIATCNRLTPMLAQQIKEELNTFKMEMDVHEESKIYTHFF